MGNQAKGSIDKAANLISNICTMYSVVPEKTVMKYLRQKDKGWQTVNPLFFKVDNSGVSHLL